MGRAERPHHAARHPGVPVARDAAGNCNPCRRYRRGRPAFVPADHEGRHPGVPAAYSSERSCAHCKRWRGSQPGARSQVSARRIAKVASGICRDCVAPIAYHYSEVHCEAHHWEQAARNDMRGAT